MTSHPYIFATLRIFFKPIPCSPFFLAVYGIPSAGSIRSLPLKLLLMINIKYCFTERMDFDIRFSPFTDSMQLFNALYKIMQTSKHPALYFPDNGSHIQTGFHASVLRCFFQKDHVRNRITCPDLWRKLLPFTFQPSEICKSLAAVIRTHQTLYHLDMVSHVMAHSTEISI